MDAEEILAIRDAVTRGDWDGALQIGLLSMHVDPAWPDAAQLLKLQKERREALEARERYRAKLKREQEQRDALARKRGNEPIPGAAQSALERAKALAAAKRK